MARLFAKASSEKIVTALGACNFVSGPCTVAAIVRFTSFSSADGRIVYFGAATTGSNRWQLIVSSTGVVQAAFASTVISAPTITVSTGSWVLLAVTKATGTVAPSFAKYVYSSDAWTYEAAGSSAANSATPATSITFGGRPDSAANTWLDGDLAICGAWNIVLSQTELQRLAFSIPAWWAQQPKGLWLFDQAATGTKLFDLTGGGANESSITGTAASTVAVPVLSYGHNPIYVDAQDPAATGRSLVVAGTAAVHRAASW